MKILIRKCNNTACHYFDRGSCDLPSQRIVPGQGLYETLHLFDYDHEAGKIVCAIPSEEESPDALL